MPKYYNGNTLDVTTKDDLANLINKIVTQIMEGKVFEDFWSTFTRKVIGKEGFQIEEVEVANLTSADFDPTGAGAFDKHDLTATAIYHKKNRNKQFVTTVSDKQMRNAMLGSNQLADMSNIIVNELYNSSAIEDYEAMKDLLKDICVDKKNMVICDLNGNGNKVDALIKAIKVLASNMTKPSTAYNYAGFKKEFNSKDDLVLIMDSSLEAVIDVDSLAGAFHMDKKSLVNNIVVVDEMPTITYPAQTKCDLVKTLSIGETNPIKINKYNASGSASVEGTAKCILCNKKAIIRNPIERVVTNEFNAKGRFYNFYLTAEDVLSYSPLKNAVVLVD